MERPIEFDIRCNTEKERYLEMLELLYNAKKVEGMLLLPEYEVKRILEGDYINKPRNQVEE